MQNLLFVFIGGGAGSVIRYFLSKTAAKPFILIPALQTPTFVANIVGSLLLGILIALFQKDKIDEGLFLFLSVGFCGGLTTFSTFILDLIKIKQSGDTLGAIIYLFLSLTVSILLAIGALAGISKLVE